MQTSEILFLICINAILSSGTLYPDKTSKKTKELKIKTGQQEQNVKERGFVVSEPLAKDILINSGTYYKETDLKNFNNTVLGYVTPWNSHGYDVAKIFAKKFNIISPVWLQINKKGGEYELAGTHDIDAGWMNEIREKGSSIKIIPRILFEQITGHDFSLLLSYETERKKANELIIKACKKYSFDGVVLEFWSQLAGRVDDAYLLNFIKEMGKTLNDEKLQLILVIPPYRESANLFSSKHLNELYKHVNAFSLMTYDYSSVQRPGANAPLKWMRTAIENLVPSNSEDLKLKRSKILMGLNMYGNDYTPDGGGPIVAGQYLDLLKNVKKRINFDENDVENYFEVRTNTGRHYVFYPSLYSINERIKLANELGVGLSIWELGQGLDYFYDLF